jgi:glycyl-tRNA synthetase beta chain
LLEASQQKVDLSALLTYAFEHSPQQKINVNTVEEVHAFILDRLKAYYHEQDYGVELIQSVLVRQSDNLYDFQQRLQAVKEFMTWEEAPALAAANKRVYRILAADKEITQEGEFDVNRLLLPAEKTLGEALKQKEIQLSDDLKQSNAENYTQALKHLSQLRQPIDTFFDSVMVNDEDESLRQNRLRLLMKIRKLFLMIADLSCLS